MSTPTGARTAPAMHTAKRLLARALRSVARGIEGWADRLEPYTVPRIVLPRGADPTRTYTLTRTPTADGRSFIISGGSAGPVHLGDVVYPPDAPDASPPTTEDEHS